MLSSPGASPNAWPSDTRRSVRRPICLSKRPRQPGRRTCHGAGIGRGAPIGDRSRSVGRSVGTRRREGGDGSPPGSARGAHQRAGRVASERSAQAVRKDARDGQTASSGRKLKGPAGSAQEQMSPSAEPATALPASQHAPRDPMTSRFRQERVTRSSPVRRASSAMRAATRSARPEPTRPTGRGRGPRRGQPSSIKRPWMEPMSG
jgi:hypothetical protein